MPWDIQRRQLNLRSESVFTFTYSQFYRLTYACALYTWIEEHSSPILELYSHKPEEDFILFRIAARLKYDL